MPTDEHLPPPEHRPLSGRHLFSRLAIHTHIHSLTQKRAKPSSTRPAKLSKKQLESRETGGNEDETERDEGCSSQQ